MTVETYDATGAVEQYDPAMMGAVGLEDVDSSDIRIPRLKIKQKLAMFEDPLTNNQFNPMRCVILTLVKGRVFWAADVDEGDRPLCKSPDNRHGFPLMSDNVAKIKQFPFDESNFEPSHAQPVVIQPMGKGGEYPNGFNSNGLGVLPCAQCNFAKWNNTKGKNTPPPCSELYTYAVLYKPDEDWDDDPSTWTPGIVSFKGAGITPAKNYNSPFATRKQPFFTAITEIVLEPRMRGDVEYSVPKFKRIGDTDRSLWQQVYPQAVEIREFLRMPPRNPNDDSDTDGSDSVTMTNTAAPQQAAPPAPPAPQAAPPAPPAPVTSPPAAPAPPAAAAVEDDDELPF